MADAVVVYIMGQSNAHGHAQDMCREGFTPHGIRFVNAQHERMCKRIPNATLYDLRESPLWDEEAPCSGLFAPDMCHYRARTQKFLAQRFLDKIL